MGSCSPQIFCLKISTFLPLPPLTLHPTLSLLRNRTSLHSRTPKAKVNSESGNRTRGFSVKARYVNPYTNSDLFDLLVVEVKVSSTKYKEQKLRVAQHVSAPLREVGGLLTVKWGRLSQEFIYTVFEIVNYRLMPFYCLYHIL